MKPKFDYDDIVFIRPEVSANYGRAWIVGICIERKGDYYNRFPPGIVYTVEFEDGSSNDFHEDDLVADGLPG